jgi:hypothetical protein
MELTAKTIAQHVGGTIEGNADTIVRNFALVAPNYFVVVVAEERRVKVDEVYTRVWHCLEYVKIVAKYYAVGVHIFMFVEYIFRLLGGVLWHSAL